MSETKTLEEALKEGNNARVLVGDKWLVWDDQWEVYQHKYGAHKVTCLYSGQNLDEAIETLTKTEV